MNKDQRYQPEQEHQALIDAANRFSIDGRPIPEQLREGIELLSAIDMILQAPDQENEATFAARKVLRIAQNMIFHVTSFLEGDCDPVEEGYRVEKVLTREENIARLKALQAA